MQSLPDVLSLRARFDGFLVDLWGVVHDGVKPFPGVLAHLAQLAEGGARVCFVSNSSRRGDELVESLVAMGIPRAHFVAVVSSGDVTREALAQRDPAVFARLAERPAVWHVGAAAYVPWLFELPFTFVSEAAEADLIVSTGTVPDRAALDALADRLEPLARRGVPMVCTNPDRLVRSASGLHLAPGEVAHAYVARGGAAFLYGKPHAPIYRAALAQLNVPTSRVVGIGDMLDTDVRGAHDAGLASVLVTGTGVHRGEIDASYTGPAPDYALETF